MKRINSDNVPKAIGPYVHATVTENLVFTSGQLGINPKNGLLEENLEEQINRALKNLDEVLKSSGSSLQKVVKTTVYLSNMDDFQTFNQIYAKFFNDSLSARTAYEVAKLPMDAKVEIEAIAEIKAK
ncbi:MAG: Rid family detoxifying hydrolase [Carnobacterium sp.]